MLLTDFKDQFQSNYGRGTLLLLPTTCTTCGSELEITDAHIHLFCPNPYCLDKTARRVVGMFDMLGVKDIGESTIKQLMIAQDFTYPMEFVLFEESDFSVDEDDYTENKIASMFRKMKVILNQLVGKREMTISRYIQLLNLPDLNTRAELLFDDCHSLEELESFLEEINNTGIDRIQSKLGISTDTSVLSIKIFETLNLYHYEIIELLRIGVTNELIKITKPKESEVYVTLVCSDQVGGGFRTKKDLYSYVDTHFGDLVGITWKSSAVKSMDALIWQGADGSDARYTSKVEKTENWNSNGADIPIITASQLVSMLENSSNGQAFLDTLQSF